MALAIEKHREERPGISLKGCVVARVSRRLGENNPWVSRWLGGSLETLPPVQRCQLPLRTSSRETQDSWHPLYGPQPVSVKGPGAGPLGVPLWRRATSTVGVHSHPDHTQGVMTVA